MINNAKVLAKILFISIFTMMYLNKTVKPVVGDSVFRTWMFSWAALTTIAFLSPKLIILFVASMVVLWYSAKRLDNTYALFIAIIFVIPAYELQTVIINLNYQKIAAITLLLPLLLGATVKQDGPKPPGHMADYLLALYLILLFFLQSRGITERNVEGFYMTYPAVAKYGMSLFLQYYLPYIIAKRYIQTFEQLKTVIIAFVCAGMLIAPIAFFELATSNMLYVAIPYNLGINWSLNGVLRDGMLRAMASIQHPLFLGMVMMITLGFYSYVKRYIKDPKLVLIGYGIIGSGLLASLSRGPWMGTAIMFVFMFLFSPNKLRNTMVFIALGTIALSGLALAGYWEKIISYIPFVGDIDSGNVDYRFLLFEKSMLVVGDSPLFGTYDPRLHPFLRPLLQGEGIVDLVNVYLAIAMSYGLIAFSLFMGVILLVMFGLLKSLMFQRDKQSEMYQAGVALFGSMMGLLFVLSVVSQVNIVGVVLFALCGISISYIRIVRQTNSKAIEESVKALPTDRVVTS